jgi:hypothetical protein
MSNLNLILHCGAAAASRSALGQVALPASTRSFQPVNHDYFVDLVQDRLEDRGLRVQSEAHGLTKDGANYFGMFEVVGKESHSDYSTVIGLRNSHAKEFAAMIAVGSGVFVCDNLAFSGEIVVGHKHTTNVREYLPLRIAAAMDQVIKLDGHQEQRYIAYKDRDFSNFEAEATIIELFRQGALNTRNLPKVVEQWDEPDHEEFKKDNVWKLFNACTESYKGTSPEWIQNLSGKLHTHLDDVCEVPKLELELEAA